jgi:hypothetical protein
MSSIVCVLPSHLCCSSPTVQPQVGVLVLVGLHCMLIVVSSRCPVCVVDETVEVPKVVQRLRTKAFNPILGNIIHDHGDGLGCPHETLTSRNICCRAWRVAQARPLVMEAVALVSSGQEAKMVALLSWEVLVSSVFLARSVWNQTSYRDQIPHHMRS